MPSSKPARRLQDIIENAKKIQTYTRGMYLAQFAGDEKTCDAVQRCLERISEAAGKLGDAASMLVPNQPWEKVRALGNRLRHEYDVIRPDRLWDIIKTDLPALSNACETALQALRNEQAR